MHSGRGPERLLFGRMYEDVEIEETTFQDKERVFCIASAGDTAICLANHHEVVACDINAAQLHYAERRADGAPFKTGDAERTMNFARTFMPLVGWSKCRIRSFLDLSDATEQAAFWQEQLDTRRFRFAFDALMSPRILRLFYAPQFLALVPPKFGAILRKRMERTFIHHPNASNPYARALLLGESLDEPRPPVRNIRFVLDDAASYLESCPASSFDAFTMSNILDGAEPAYRSRLSQAVRHAAAEDAVVVLRSFREPPPGFRNNLAARDRSMLWGIVSIGSARKF